MRGKYNVVTKLCSIDGCGKKHYGYGYCEMHLTRIKRHGDVGKPGLMVELHGMKYTPEYQVWENIKNRCREDYRFHKDYFDRGIKVCEGITEYFSAFYNAVGPRPSNKHTIDRADNDGNYSCGKCEECVANGWPMNCRWAVRLLQNLNQRPRKKVRTGLPQGVNFNGERYAAYFRGEYLGTFDAPEQASEVYETAKSKCLKELTK
jgi:hypothetical protein